MTLSPAAIGDHLDTATGFRRGDDDPAGISGWLHVQLIGPDGNVKADQVVPNLVTREGDRYYGDRAAGIAGAPAAITGMQLGTGNTAPAKTGAGAAIVTLVPASLEALSAAPTSALNGEARRISYAATWSAGEATANGIAEVALTNQPVATQTAAPAAATIARALLNPVVNKGANDTLSVAWHHDLLGTPPA